MKKALLAALFVMVISSWCLAQTDSLPAPTAEPCQPATCSEPCQPGACPVPCQPAPCAEPFGPKWAVGLSFSRLINLPGTFLLERLNKKSSIEYYLSVTGDGHIVSRDNYLEARNDYAHLGVGFNYKRRIFENNDTPLKLDFGFGPRVTYTRSDYKHYYDWEDEYSEDIINFYGVDMSVFARVCLIKDMAINNIRLRHEIAFVPAIGYAEIKYMKRYISPDEKTIEGVDVIYGISAISTGSVSYSIKYLF